MIISRIVVVHQAIVMVFTEADIALEVAMNQMRKKAVIQAPIHILPLTAQAH